MLNPTYPDYREFEDALECCDGLRSPAEAHGVVCGLAVLDRNAAPDWLTQIREKAESGDARVAELDAFLEQLFATTVAQLEDSSCGFTLLLPSDDEALTRRARALGRWCTGFLYGLGVAGIEQVAIANHEVREFLSDLSEIARAGIATGSEEGDEDETAYVELVEYVRMGVLIIDIEIRPRTAPGYLH